MKWKCRFNIINQINCKSNVNIKADRKIIAKKQLKSQHHLIEKAKKKQNSVEKRKRKGKGGDVNI